MPTTLGQGAWWAAWLGVMGSWGCDKAFKLKALSIMTCPAGAAAFALASYPSRLPHKHGRAISMRPSHVCGADGMLSRVSTCASRRAPLELSIRVAGTCRQPMSLGTAPLSGRQGWPRIKVEAKLLD
ncbi:hypothetical protein IWX49DRAFT_126079 [Phyllosticta citricarpa]|uniref:Secreted protein n=1 Tax=Phyllosticta citricarpa TaxID=55181 RepID=A0ABR1MNE3_9PEZI